MLISSFLRNFLFIVILHLCNAAFCQDTIYRLNKAALIGIIKQDNAEKVKISLYKNGRIKERNVARKQIISLNRGNTNGYFVFNEKGKIDKKAFKTKISKSWKELKKKEKSYSDTLVLIDRKAKARMFVGINNNTTASKLFYYRKPGRTKVTAMELEKIYSVNYASAKPKLILYIQDTLEGNWYTAEQMSDYMKGQNDAYRNYKKRARLAAISGFLVGMISPGIDNKFGPFIVIGYTGLVGFSKPRFKSKLGYNSDYKDNLYYKEGFGTMAKRLTVWHVATATISGYIIGAVGLTFLEI